MCQNLIRMPQFAYKEGMNQDSETSRPLGWEAHICSTCQSLWCKRSSICRKRGGHNGLSEPGRAAPAIPQFTKNPEQLMWRLHVRMLQRHGRENVNGNGHWRPALYFSVLAYLHPAILPV